MGYYWFCLRLWLRERPEKIAWWIAWRLPRKVALYAFVRVSCGSLSGPTKEYADTYNAWERGAGW